ncbi:phage/plasmid primase, P4 family [Falsiroseomonas sp. HW251]|uniref:phage/plasmid primase, P4 family n=1 Tax=Falsiroseomonas sp. HW251 TaxID=3390998 RepID=UPI003D31AF24
MELTEHGVAAAFAREHRDLLRYCHSKGAWYVWQDTHWAKYETRLTFDLARDLADRLSAGMQFRIRAAVGRANFTGAVERFAQADQTFALTAAAWDPDPWLLGTPAGTVDLRTGLICRARREDMITRLTACAPADRVDCPLFLAFLNQATGGDQDLMTFLQRWFGYSLTGVTNAQSLVFIHGGGGNGKGVLLQTVNRIFGSYAVTAAMDTFTAQLGHRHSTDLAMLHGARLVLTTEVEEGKPWAEARIKTLTGGDPITARFMNRDNFTFTPTFKLTISGNHQPALQNVDDAARRRIHMIPFGHKPSVPDPYLTDKLQREWPSILRWMIEGCLAWQEHGLGVPQIVVDATQSYFDDQDVVQHWIDERCEVSPKVGDAVAVLSRSWQQFARDRGEDVRSPKWLAAVLQRRGFVKDKDCELFRGRGYRGICVRRHVQSVAATSEATDARA